ncbi:MAG TPA: O-antigen ligase family protein [Kiritimatiellia bacterium]|jgi:hypothetical protein|nr:O-antigen ligase family protein [Kiritimatiellia bacterium]HOM59337.1 O-antigen ligase family protein [Kiritimatiellia bacterium]HOR98129.1 O-antigen ligase family protein [Kiritimatiellia bacterium]HPC49000.1 O-antigen ligase family protein [Kiritimatiellia bacterium]HPK37358.1 O-antigen ligase family protein [Kiritimatiellia bacterium]
MTRAYIRPLSRAAFPGFALAALCAAPTQWSLIPSLRIGVADLLLACAAALVVLECLLARDGKKALSLRPHWTHLLFILASGAALSAATDRMDALKEWVQGVEYFIIAPVVFTALLRKERLFSNASAEGAASPAASRVPPGFIALGAVTAVVLGLAVIQYLAPEGHDSIRLFAEPKTLDIIVNVLGGRESPLLVGGTFGNRNVLGGFLALALPLCAVGALASGRAIWTRIACALLLLTGLAVNLSGASYWAVVVVIAAIAATRGARVFLPVMLALMLWQTEVLKNLPRENDLCHFESVALYDSAGLPTRRYPEWQAAVGMILTHPWLGVGPGHYQKRIGSFYGQVPNATGPAEPDIQNLYLVLGASCGLPALFAFLLMLASALGAATRSGRWGAAGALAAFAVTAVWHPLLVRGIGLPLAFVLALAHHPKSPEADYGY